MLILHDFVTYIYIPRTTTSGLSAGQGSLFLLKGDKVLVILAQGPHLFPSRTQQLSLAAPMILLSGKVGRRQDLVSLFLLNLWKDLPSTQTSSVVLGIFY